MADCGGWPKVYPINMIDSVVTFGGSMTFINRGLLE